MLVSRNHLSGIPGIKQRKVTPYPSVTMITIIRLVGGLPQSDEREEVPQAPWILINFTRSSRSSG